MRNLTLHTMGLGSDNADNKDGTRKVDVSTNLSMINCPTILTGMSHEVRTHMNAIVAFSYLMNRNSNNDSEREEFSNQILASCEQLIGLLDNFLDSAIIESGKLTTDLRICKLTNVLDELLAEFRDMIKREGQQDVVLVTESCPDPTDVIIDSDRVFRVIRILFQNALQNTNSGYIKIGYEFRDEKVTFYVLDSGQGYFKCKEFLHTEDLNGSLAKYNDTVSAINITLAKKIISILGGAVWIECNGLTGTGIYFSVPAKETAEGSDININKFVNSMIAI
ncbi:MAG: HAMP domain-containing histidine kinase [Bacteroidales bacterium]|nr:HAMP domain-containing histidine kinase [Bacteroidales bacterium]